MGKICRWRLVSSPWKQCEDCHHPIFGAATKFGSQAAWKKQEEPDAYKFSTGKHGKPHTSTAFPRFSLSKGAVVPKFWLLGSVAVVPTARPGADVETEKEIESRKTVSAVFRNQFRKVINNRWWNVINIMSAEFLHLPQKNPATHIYIVWAVYNDIYIYIYDKQGGSFLVGVRKRLRLYRWATSSEFQHYIYIYVVCDISVISSHGPDGIISSCYSIN